MAKDEAVEARREKAGRLLIRGFSAAAVAKSMNVDRRTIERDNFYNRRKWIKEFKKEPIEKLLHFLAKTNEETIKENWKVLENTAEEKTKLDASGGINKFLLTRLQIMKSMGVIDKIPEKVELSGAIGLHQAITIGADAFEQKKKEDAVKPGV